MSRAACHGSIGGLTDCPTCCQAWGLINRYHSTSLRYRQNCLELLHSLSTAWADRTIETVVDVIVNEVTPCLADRLFDRDKLLCQLKAIPAFVKHRDDAANMPFRPLEPVDNVRKRLVDVVL